MTDPLRWSAAGGTASDTERTLLRAAEGRRMPESDKVRVWEGISASLPPMDVPTGTPEHSTASASVARHAALLQLGKTLSVVALASGLSVAGYRAARDRSRVGPNPPTIAPSVMLTSDPRQTLVAPTPREPTETTSELHPTVAPRLHTTATGSTPYSQLQQEKNALLAARQALRSNDPSKALRLLEQAQLRFRPGMLLEERSALMIEALARSGNAPAAAAQARSFLKNYPKSPHAVDVRQHLAP